MGSTITAATGTALWVRMSFRASRHLDSSLAFSSSLPFSGYLSLGKGADGQLNAGMSSWVAAGGGGVGKRERT